ncbi:spore germination protein Q [Pullulanibacillus pueri]|uniref:Spore coat protein GerQ n=1 Tax=Pullulanibacillus pueri TaxID=1437324 RepID=A0A8J3ENU8_9BACL|nr:spore coat protein GerQ [Pullulanibacillus pueri]MBM7683180.1 spore germination protein Q [Pullulanibacillus pueri]GGH85654.1 hypothetical protein GCM10007096_31550 [Pullulanibacillus pueri]
MSYNNFRQEGWPQGTPPQYDGQQQPPTQQQPQQQQPSAYPMPPSPPGVGAGAGTGTTPPVHAVSPYIPGPTGFTEQSYIENILRMNLEKVATVYMTFEHEGGAESKAFRGEIEAAGRDHVIINDNKTGTRYLLPLIYLDYVTFQGPIHYAYPY